MEKRNQLVLLCSMMNQSIEQSILFSKYFYEVQNTELDLSFITVDVPHVRIADFFEEWIPRYLDTDFFNLFRMTKQTFNTLFQILRCDEKEYVGDEEPVKMEKALLITLWWLGKGEVLLSIADRFNVSVSTVHKVTTFMLNKLINLRETTIVWPDRNEIVTVERAFRNRCGYPGVIGAIDVCNIRFKAPSEQQDSYIDKNRNHSIKLQGIATSNKIFTDVMVGFPGSAHDSRVLQNSQIFENIEHRGLMSRYFYEMDYHILGDKAYPIRSWIMTPYRHNNIIQGRQRYHNKCHSKTRIVVEHTFGILKSRWRILSFINVNSVPKAVKIIMACCVLHNFCYINSDFWQDYAIVEADVHMEPEDDVINIANQKRNNIANILWEQR